MAINKKDIEKAIEGLTVIETKPEPIPLKIDISKLSSVEKRHMEAFVARGMPSIDNYDKERLLEAYLAGADVQEMVQMFPGTEAGGIVYLKISEGWQALRREYIEDLQYKSQIKLMETKANAVSSVSMLVNLFHKEIQPKILQYMQTGDAQYLPKRFGIKSFADYKKFIDLLSKLSKLSPGEVMSVDAPSTVNIKTENLNIGDDNRSVEINKKPDDLQSSAHKLLSEFYAKK
ncbi:MAG TPA: hypothetical protein VK590_05100 [Saprospiraceae bacterium]|nr:hypothetical protein [Saprospiraceae bacterium]